MRYVSEPEFWGGDAREFSLRKYQEDSIHALRENIRAGIRSQILASMVGSGKTICAAYLLNECYNKGRHGLFVVDRTNLLDQTSAVLRDYGIPHGVWKTDHGLYRPGELIQVATIQTLSRRGWPPADLIVNDECHASYAAMLKKIDRNDARVIGLSATPFTKGLGKHYKAIVNVTTGNKLTAEGFLVPFKVWAAAEPDMTGAKVVAGEWTDEEASKRSVKIVGDVVREYQRHGEDRKSIIFGVDVAHCEALQAQFLSAGINVALYTYMTDDEEREMMLREFRKPDSSIRGLISVAALSRGFDVPDVGCIIMCRPLKSSFAEFVQILGRGLRSHPSKADCRILDLAGNFMRHYPALIEFMEEGVNHLDDGKKKASKPAVKKERKPVKCPACKFVFGGGPSCPACGHIFKTRSSVEHEDGELSGFDGAAVVKYDRAAKGRLYGELLWIANEKGYKDGWVAHTYRSATGVWPRNLDRIRYEPSIDTLRLVNNKHRKSSKTLSVKASAPLALDLFQ